MLPSLRHRPVLVAAAGFGLMVGLACAGFGMIAPSAVLLGWCSGVLAYVIPTFRLMQRSKPDSVRRRAEQLDEGEGAVLAGSLAAAVASLGPVIWFLKSNAGPPGGFEITLALASVALSWVFVHILFAVRYAHEYWQAGGGLDFPGDEAPAFADFLYFAFTIGMTFQTADVAVSTRLLRQLTLVHALVSFLFNVVIVATAVNLAAGLIQ